MHDPVHFNRVFVVHKEEGPSSFDIVRRIKRLFPRGVKVGHCGSLDPFASGVLVILVGKATKLSDRLLQADKKYEGTVQLGSATNTYDKTGVVTDQRPIPQLEKTHIEAALASFEGIWEQRPPAFSAKKQNGVRLYALARQNIAVSIPITPVRIYSATLTTWIPPSVFDFKVHCSKGTYIRSLAEELSQRLGTVGHLARLVRTSCGIFSLEEAKTVEEISTHFETCDRIGYANLLRLVRLPSVTPASQAPSLADSRSPWYESHVT